jgi:hypothetical protein
VVTRALFAVGVALLLSVVPGCAAATSPQETMLRSFSPQMNDNAHPLAYQAAALSHGFMNSHMAQWDARLANLEDDLPPFLAALDAAGFRADYEIVKHPPAPGEASYEWYGVNLMLLRKGAKHGAGDRFLIPGDQGMKMTAYVAALGPASKATGIPAEILRRGHFAMFGLVTMSSALNGTEDAMRKHAFWLLVVRERLNAGDSHADPFTAMRSPDHAKEDADIALRVVADHHAEVGTLRAEVLALLTLARDADVPAARDALSQQITDSRAHANAWRDSHPRPKAEDFGVAMKPMSLPTPENMLAKLDKDGYIAAATQVAKGIATGDAAATAEGIGKLAPPNSSLRVAAQGVSAGLHGDIAGAADAALALAEKQEDVAPIVARLRSVQAAVADARGKVDQVRGQVSRGRAAIDTAKGVLTDPAKAAGTATQLP